jgi:predicted nucleotidyltransferase
LTLGREKPFRDLVVDLHESLDAEAIPHAFGGALALAYHVVSPRATDDIDMNIAVSKDDSLRVFRALPSGVRWGSRLLRLAETTGAVKLRWFRGVTVDLFFRTNDYHRVVQERAETHPFADTELPFVSATDMTILKATFDRGMDKAGKERDWTDIRLMLEARTPDVREVMRWVERLEGKDSDNLATLRALVAETS